MPPHDVLREVTRAKAAVDTVTLDGADGLVLGELIARNQLMLISSESANAARLVAETPRGQASP